MKCFKDDKGREWKVSATVGSLRRARDLVKVDLTELSKGEPALARLTSEPFLVAEVLEACPAAARGGQRHGRRFSGLARGRRPRRRFRRAGQGAARFFRENREGSGGGGPHGGDETAHGGRREDEGENRELGHGEDGRPGDRGSLLDTCDEVAGIVGVDPEHLTLRRLLRMSEARRKDEWNRLSQLLCLLANVNRDPKQRREPFTPAEFDPFRKAEETPKERVTGKVAWDVMQKVFRGACGSRTCRRRLRREGRGQRAAGRGQMEKRSRWIICEFTASDWEIVLGLKRTIRAVRRFERETRKRMGLPRKSIATRQLLPAM